MMSGSAHNSRFLYDRALSFFFRLADLLYFFHIRRGEKLRFSHINARKERKRPALKKKKT